MKHKILNTVFLCFLATFVVTANAKSTSLLDMADQLDALDKQDFQVSIDRANSCTSARNFSCSDSELSKAAKAANTMAVGYKVF